MSVTENLIEHETHHPGSRWLIMLVAVATVMAAGVAFLQARAANADEQNASRARDLAVGAMAVTEQSVERSLGLALHQAETASREVEAGLLLRSRLLGRGDGLDPQGQVARLYGMANHIRTEAGLRSRSPSGDSGSSAAHAPEDSADSGIHDPAPRLAATLERNLLRSHRLWALQDAARETSLAWGNRAAALAAALAMIAVAVYLLALALTVDDPGPKRGLGILGVILLTTAGGWTALGPATTPIPKSSSRAAEAYARGIVTLNAAQDSSDYLEAKAAFDLSIKERPTFGEAYSRRAQAIFGARSPQAGSAYMSVTDPRVLGQVIADEQRAEELGYANYALFTDMGFNWFLRGAYENRPELFGRSLKHTRRAIRLAPEHPVLYYNLGLTYLAQGERRRSQQAYTRAVELTTRTTDLDAVAGALTDLEILLEAQPRLDPEVAATKERLVRLLWEPLPRSTADAGASADSGLRGTKIDVSPGRLRLFSQSTQPLGRRDVVVHWYRREATSGVWIALRGTTPAVPARALIPSHTGGSLIIDKERYLAETGRCLEPGAYRAEVYVRGQIQAVVSKRVRFPRLEAFRDHLLAIDLCAPADWKVATSSLPGFRTVLGDDDGASVTLMRAHDRGNAARADVRGYVRGARRRLRSVIGGEGRIAADAPSAFMGLSDAVIERYVRRGRESIIAAGESSDGDIIVGAIAGPCGAALIGDVFASLSEHDPLPQSVGRDRLGEVHEQLLARIPSSWNDKTREGRIRIVEKRSGANLLGSSDRVSAYLDSQDIAEVNVADLTGFAGYEELEFRQVPVNRGGSAYVHRYRWESDGLKVEQMQLYWVEQMRSYTLTASWAARDTKRLRPIFERMLSALVDLARVPRITCH